MAKDKLRIIFMGTPEFAVPSLQILLENNYTIAGVVTAPDRMGGRGMKMLLKSAVKEFAEKHSLKILQPTNLKSPAFLNDLNALQADLQVVVAFRMLPVAVWNMPSLGTMNLHASLLPKYRGAAPIHWAVINGEEKTGLTTFLLKHEIDTGDILLQREIAIGEDETTGELHDRMKETGAELVLESVRLIGSGSFETIPQDSLHATKAPKIHHEDARVDFNQPVRKVYNFIRGMSPYPAAWTLLDGKELKILRCSMKENGLEGTAGSVMTDKKTELRIFAEDGAIELENVKMEGKRRMDVAEFLNGYKGEFRLS